MRFWKLRFDLLNLLLNQALADGFRFGAGEIVEPFAERQGGVQLAEMSFFAAFQQIHNQFARSAAAIPGGAERRDIAHFREFANHAIQAARVAEHKLLLVAALRVIH